MAGERPVDPRLFSEWGLMLVRPCEGDPDEINRVRDAMESLSQRDRDMLDGVFYERVSKTELARRYNVSRHDIGRWYVLALRALKAALEEDHG